MIGEMMVCPNCGRVASHDSYFSAMVCRQCGWIKYDSPTNADRIRSMSDEELANLITKTVDCDKEQIMCNPEEYKRTGKCNGKCLDGRLNWLRQPAEEERDGQTI